jgi:hypothetical protein
MDRAPACMAEFYDCEYQLLQDEEDDSDSENVAGGGAEHANKANLKAKQDILNYLETYGASDRQLAHFRNQHHKIFGQELIWNYPICDGEHFGFYIVPVREGFLNLPYYALDEEEHELLVLENAYLISAEDLEVFLNEWRSYSDGLISAMEEMITIAKEESEHAES